MIRLFSSFLFGMYPVNGCKSIPLPGSLSVVPYRYQSSNPDRVGRQRFSEKFSLCSHASYAPFDPGRVAVRKRFFLKGSSQIGICCRLLLCLSICLLASGLSAQLSDGTIRRISTLEGLSQNDIKCVFEDSRGVIWVGTNDGLNRYDGTHFQTYYAQPGEPSGLKGNRIFSISEDSNHVVWIGSRFHEVSFFDLKTDRFVPQDSLPPAYHLPPEFIFSEVIHLPNGEHWICGEGDVLISSSDGVRSLKAEGLIPDSCPISLPQVYANGTDEVWVLCRKTFVIRFKLKPSGEIQATIFPKSFASYRLTDLIFYQDAVIFSGLTGLYVMPSGSQEPIHVATLYANSLLQHDSSLWVGTQEGCWTYPIDTLLVMASGYPASSPASFPILGKRLPRFSAIVNDMLLDSRGSIWIGTNHLGLAQWYPSRNPFRTYAVPGCTETPIKINALFEDSRGRVWVGGTGKGLFRLQQTTQSERQLVAVNQGKHPVNSITCIREWTFHGTSYLLIGGKFPYVNTLFEFVGDSLQEVPLPYRFLSHKGGMMDFIQDSIWIWSTVFGKGLYRYNLSNGEQVHFPLGSKGEGSSPTKSRRILLDRNGHVWVGTSKGLFLIVEEEKHYYNPRIIHFKHTPQDSSSLSADYILPLLESSTGDIWIGTLGGGLNRWIDRTQCFEHWTMKDGLPSNTIKGILEDDEGNLWLSSNKGLSQFSPKEGWIKNYSPSDGLQGNEFSDLACIKQESGEMLFGGVRGMNACMPQRIQPDGSTTAVILTDLFMFNKRVAPLQPFDGHTILNAHINDSPQLHLSSHEHTITLHFSGANYQSPEKIQYQYRLVGLDDAWIRTDATSRFARYTKIPPGSYQFEVMASNADGKWNGPTKRLKIIIKPPWWKSNVAYGCYLFLLSLAFILSKRYSLIRNHRKQTLIMQAFEKEKVQELAQMNVQFFTNVSHEFRTPLTLIQGYVDYMLTTNPPHKEGLHIVQRNTRILLKLVSELMDLQKLDQDQESLDMASCDVVDLVARSVDSFQWWAQQTGISLEKRLPQKPLTVWGDPHQLERVLYNLLSNSCKYTPKGGKIQLALQEKDQHVWISVQDTGVGIPKANQASIFNRFYQATKTQELKSRGAGIGLAYAKAIVEKHQGRLFFQSTEGVGSTFFVVIPVGKRPFSKGRTPGNSHAHPGSVCPEDPSSLQVLTEAPPTKEGDTSRKQPHTHAPHLLIVEDNHSVRALLKELLSEQYHIHETAGAEEALAFCLTHPPDLVISDIMMPGMDGLALCTQLKTKKQTSHIPVILLTARDSPEMKLQSFEHGADAYLTKPFDMSVLNAQIKAVLNSRDKLREQINQSGYKVALKEVHISTEDTQFMDQVVNVMEEHILDVEYSVTQFAETLSMSQSTFSRKLKAITGHTPVSFMRDYRLKRAAQLLTQEELTIKEVFYQTGIANIKLFRTYFKKAYGVTPKAYQASHRAQNG